MKNRKVYKIVGAVVGFAVGLIGVGFFAHSLLFGIIAGAVVATIAFSQPPRPTANALEVGACKSSD